MLLELINSGEAVLKRTHNMCFRGDLRKHIMWFPTLICSYNRTIIPSLLVCFSNGRGHMLYSRTSLFRTRLFRITAYLEVKIWSLF